MNQTIQCLLSRVNHKLLFKNTFIEILLIYYKVQMFKVYTSMGFSIFSNVSITKINFRTFLGLKRNFVFVSSHSSFQIPPPHTYTLHLFLSIYVYLCQFHTVLITVALCLVLKLGGMSTLIFFSFKIFFGGEGRLFPGISM
jgi:hypothetical protein